MNGVVGLAFWLAFFGILIASAVITRRHDRKTELDVYERMRGGGWG